MTWTDVLQLSPLWVPAALLIGLMVRMGLYSLRQDRLDRKNGVIDHAPPNHETTGRWGNALENRE